MEDAELMSIGFAMITALVAYIWKANSKRSDKQDKLMEESQKILTELRIMTAENKLRLDNHDKDLEKLVA